MAAPAKSKSLKDVFTEFATFGAGNAASAALGIEGRTFVKCMKDAALLSKGFTATDCDLIFTAVKPKGAKRITFETFEQSLEKVAAKKKVPVAEVIAAIVACGGPKSSGTQAEYNKFFDDKSTWTGVATRGGPTNVDGQKDLSSLCDRTAADARGVAKHSNFSRQH